MSKSWLSDQVNPVAATEDLFNGTAANDISNAGGHISGSDAKNNAADAAQGKVDAAATATAAANNGVLANMQKAGDDYTTDVAGHEANNLTAGKQIYGKYTTARAPITSSEKGANTNYATSVGNTQGQYQGAESALSAKASDQATNAEANYTNSIQPDQKNLMEQTATQAGGAMSLADLGNMNNSVQTGVRNFYNTEAQNEGQQGLASSGVLAAMGAQATANAGGNGVPMTGSQLQLLGANNQAQAGQAYAATQQRMQALKDQGISQGISQSNNVYQAGQNAIGLAGTMAQEAQQGQSTDVNQQQNLRGEQGTYAGNIANSQMTASGATLNATQANNNIDLGNLNQDTNFAMGQSNQVTANAIGIDNAKLQQANNIGNLQMGVNNNQGGQQMAGIAAGQGVSNAIGASQAQMVGAGIGAAGTALGAILAGPLGAAAGGSLGSVTSQMISSQPTTIQPGSAGAMPQGQYSVFQPQGGGTYQPQGIGINGYNPSGYGVQNQMQVQQ